jgi:hypothetical protein
MSRACNAIRLVRDAANLQQTFYPRTHPSYVSAERFNDSEGPSHST